MAISNLPVEISADFLLDIKDLQCHFSNFCWTVVIFDIHSDNVSDIVSDIIGDIYQDIFLGSFLGSTLFCINETSQCQGILFRNKPQWMYFSILQNNQSISENKVLIKKLFIIFGKSIYYIYFCTKYQ